MNPEQQAGLEFSCIMCGTCCSHYQVRLTLSEARHISEHLGFDWEEFSRRYTDKRWPGSNSLLLKHNQYGCVFLKRSSGEKIAKCSIHSFKPDSCKEWTPGVFRHECQSGLKNLWNINVDQAGTITGSPVDLEKYTGFQAGLDDCSIDTGE